MAKTLKELISEVNKVTKKEKENEIVKKGVVSNESLKGLNNFKPDKDKTNNNKEQK